MQSSSLAAQVFNSYFECPWEHCKADRGTEQQLSHEQQVNLVILNLWVYKHSWIQTAGQLLFALLCPQDLNRTPGTKMVLNSGWVFFLLFSYTLLNNIQGKKPFPLTAHSKGTNQQKVLYSSRCSSNSYMNKPSNTHSATALPSLTSPH